jgi:hypothetical protein
MDNSERAKRLAALAHPQARASAKDGAVQFGRPANQKKPAVSMTAAEFEALSDDAVVTRLVEAWR